MDALRKRMIMGIALTIGATTATRAQQPPTMQHPTGYPTAQMPGLPGQQGANPAAGQGQQAPTTMSVNYSMTIQTRAADSDEDYAAAATEATRGLIALANNGCETIQKSLDRTCALRGITLNANFGQNGPQQQMQPGQMMLQQQVRPNRVSTANATATYLIGAEQPKP